MVVCGRIHLCLCLLWRWNSSSHTQIFFIFLPLHNILHRKCQERYSSKKLMYPNTLTTPRFLSCFRLGKASPNSLAYIPKLTTLKLGEAMGKASIPVDITSYRCLHVTMTCKADDYVETQPISVQGVGAIAFKFLASNIPFTWLNSKLGIGKRKAIGR